MPKLDKWRIVLIAKEHDRKHFDCGDPVLNEWLQKYAGQSQDLGIVRTYVLLPKGESAIKGYFAIRAGHVAFPDLPQELRKRLPRYPVPVIHLARLALDRSLRGKGFGGDLLISVLEKALFVSRSLGIHAIEVVAKNSEARRFYEHFGFRALSQDRDHLYLPISAVRKLLGDSFERPCPECGDPMIFHGLDRADNYAWTCERCRTGVMGHLTHQTITVRCRTCGAEGEWSNRSREFAQEIRIGSIHHAWCSGCRTRTDQEILTIEEENPEQSV